jgi:putative oxidoreductase
VNAGLLLLRTALSLLLMAHASQKLFGWFGGQGPRGFATALEKMGIRPGLPFSILAGVSQGAGAALLGLGLLGPVGPLMLASSMVVVALTLGRNGFWNMRGGCEYGLVLAVAFLSLSLTGPGRYSLDDALGVSMPEPWTWIAVAVAGLAGIAATQRTKLIPAASGRRSGLTTR